MANLFILVFLSILAVVGVACWLAYAFLFSARRRGLIRQLEGEASAEATGGTTGSIFIEAEDAARVRSLPGALLRHLQLEAAAGGLDWTGGGVLGVSFGLALAGAIFGYYYPLLIFRAASSVIMACCLGAIPILIIKSKKAKRMAQFEEQFPEALEFIARALRAGHAFSVSLEMLATEAPEPLSTEFRRVFQESNLGSPLETTLLGLAERVPLVDVKFFVSAVILQREAGGNLSEILTNLAHTVRERFRLRGHVRAATAHARITATLLSIMPIIVLVGLRIRSPEYIMSLVNDPMGPWMLLAALCAQITGYLLMRKMINFRI